VGEGDLAACDQLLFDPSELGDSKLHWFEFDSDRGPVRVGFATPAGGPDVPVGTEVDFFFVHDDSGQALTIESRGQLLAHSTHGTALPVGAGGLRTASATCDEVFGECRVSRYQLYHQWDDDHIYIDPGDTKRVGPFSDAPEMPISKSGELPA
jgi:hypothetical protein